MATEDYFSIDDILSSEPRFMSTFRVRGYQLAHLDPMGVKATLLAQPLQLQTPSPATVNRNNHLQSSSSSAPPSASLSSSAPPSQSNNTPDDDDHHDDNDDEDHIPVNHKLALPFWLAETLAERNVVTVRLPHCFQTRTRHALRADAPSVSLYSKCPTYYALGIRIARLVKDISLPLILTRAFANRCWSIVDQAAYCSTRGSKALAKLDLLERKLFFVSHAVHNSVIHWKERSFDRIASFQPILGKRQRASLENESDVASAITPPVNSRSRRVFA